MSAPGAGARERPRVLVAGGGVAALEALLALHELVGRHAHLELLAPGTRVPEPARVRRRAVRARRPRRPCRSRRSRGAATPSCTAARSPASTGDAGVALTADGDGASASTRSSSPSAPARRRALPGAHRLRRPAGRAGASRACSTRPRAARSGAIVFAMASPGVAWTLPLYELAIMTAVELRDRGADARRDHAS